jgi:hypothetical protein
MAGPFSGRAYIVPLDLDAESAHDAITAIVEDFADGNTDRRGDMRPSRSRGPTGVAIAARIASWAVGSAQVHGEPISSFPPQPALRVGCKRQPTPERPKRQNPNSAPRATRLDWLDSGLIAKGRSATP